MYLPPALFAGMDWDLVLHKQYTPEFIPVVTAGDLDLGNVDSEFTREMPKVPSRFAAFVSEPSESFEDLGILLLLFIPTD